MFEETCALQERVDVNSHTFAFDWISMRAGRILKHKWVWTRTMYLIFGDTDYFNISMSVQSLPVSTKTDLMECVMLKIVCPICYETDSHKPFCIFSINDNGVTPYKRKVFHIYRIFWAMRSFAGFKNNRLPKVPWHNEAIIALARMLHMAIYNTPKKYSV